VGNGWPKTRQLVDAAAPPSNLSSDAFNSAQTKLDALTSVVKNSMNLTPFADVLLSTQSVLLSSSQQTTILTALDGLIEGRAHVVALSPVHNIRLTSQTATIPITLLRQVPYPVTVELDLSSEKLQFLHGTNPQTVTLTQRVQSVNVEVYARTSGDFPVLISVRSPTAGLEITSATFTVRSLSTSVVAIVLSVVAALVLLMWWGRTLWSGRRGRRALAHQGVHKASRHDEAGSDKKVEPAGPDMAGAGAPGAEP
jgi:hypothetical protein